MELEGAAALVTGGASGIGAATVGALQAEGCRVAVLDREPGAAKADVVIECDVAEEEQVVDAVAAARDHLGGLDVAVLSAGVGGGMPLIDMTTQEWDRVHAVNLRGVFVSLRESAKAMTSGGSIVTVASVSAFTTERWIAHYSASKAGVVALTRTAARELGPSGIRVNAVAPGVTDTPMFAQSKTLPGFAEQVVSRTALGRLGTADDLAEAVIGLCRMDWVTGQVLIADGGLTRWSPLDPLEASEREPGPERPAAEGGRTGR